MLYVLNKNIAYEYMKLKFISFTKRASNKNDLKTHEPRKLWSKNGRTPGENHRIKSQPSSVCEEWPILTPKYFKNSRYILVIGV